MTFGRGIPSAPRAIPYRAPNAKFVMQRPILYLFLTCMLLPPNAAATLTPRAQIEIEHLLLYVERSGCEFYRNGSWYDAAAAERHLRFKYEWFKDSLDGAEDFIGKAASRSSVSGQAYEVKCGFDAPRSSAMWLTDELRHFRAALNDSPRAGPDR